jgi:hypothetical protein
MEKISSIWRSTNDWRIRYRYYLDGNEIWFNFKDVCEVLNIDISYFTGNYFKMIPDFNKRIFLDNTGSQRYDRVQFINKVAYDELISNELMRNAIELGYDMKLLINELGMTDNNNFGAKYEIGSIISELSKKNVDIEKVRKHAKNLFNTPELQDIMYTKYNSDKVREYNKWINDENSENNMFIAHKENNEVHTWQGPTIDEALDILYKAGLE